MIPAILGDSFSFSDRTSKGGTKKLRACKIIMVTKGIGGKTGEKIQQKKRVGTGKNRKRGGEKKRGK